MEVKVIGQMDNTMDHTFESANRVYDTHALAPTINTCGGGGLQPEIIDEPKCLNSKGGRGGVEGLQPSLQDRVYSTDAVSVAVTTAFMPSILEDKTSVQKDNLVMETVRIKQATSQGYAECKIGGVADLSFPDSKTRRGRVQEKGKVSPTLMAGEQDICRIERNDNFYLSDKGKKYVCDPKRGMCTDINADVCQTLTAKGQSNWTGSFVSPDIDSLEKSTNIGSSEPTLIHLKDGTTITSNDSLAQYRIRKLTPRECWRLMDFTDEDFEKAAEVNSATQLYKQAGNSIVRNVLVAIIGQMLPGKENIYKGEQHGKID